jgi:hypothetical protein
MSPQRRVSQVTVARRISAARKDARGADADVKAASAAALKSLLRLDAQKRFEALHDPATDLTDEDRRLLTGSLLTPDGLTKKISAGVASRLTIWRSRAHYRGGGLFGPALAVLTLAGLVGWGYRQTPEQWVVIDPSLQITGFWQLPDGSIRQDDFVSGRRYQLHRRQSDEGYVRYWIPSVGYAEVHLNLNALRAAP